MKKKLKVLSDWMMDLIYKPDVDPFEPPMPPKTDMAFVNNLAKSFAKGQPYRGRIGLTLFRDKVHEVFKDIHSHPE